MPGSETDVLSKGLRCIRVWRSIPHDDVSLPSCPTVRSRIKWKDNRRVVISVTLPMMSSNSSRSSSRTQQQSTISWGIRLFISMRGASTTKTRRAMSSWGVSRSCASYRPIKHLQSLQTTGGSMKRWSRRQAHWEQTTSETIWGRGTLGHEKAAVFKLTTEPGSLRRLKMSSILQRTRLSILLNGSWLRDLVAMCITLGQPPKCR